MNCFSTVLFFILQLLILQITSSRQIGSSCVTNKAIVTAKTTNEQIKRSELSPTTSGSSDVSTSILNLAKTILGAGILSLPSGVALVSDSKTALFPAIGLLGVMGLASAYSFSSIGKACELHGVKTFAEAYARSFNQTSGAVISSVVTFKTFFACLAYSIIIGDSFSQIARTLGGGPRLSHRSTSIVTWTLALAPLCLLKDLGALRYTSLLGLGGVLYCALFTGLRALDGSYRNGAAFYSTLDAAVKPSFGLKTGSLLRNPEVFRLIAMISSAYVAHYNAPKFWTELKDATREKFNTVIASAFSISFVAYSAVMIAGFLTFGGTCQGFILNNYASNDVLATVARVAIGLGIVFGYPLTFSALRDGVTELLGARSLYAKERLFLPLTAALLTLLTVAALTLRDVGFVVSFGGALIGAMLIFTIPALMNLENMRKFPKRFLPMEKALNRGLAGLGVVVAVIGVYMNLLSLGKGVATPH